MPVRRVFRIPVTLSSVWLGECVMLSVLVLLLVVAAASFAYRAFWMLRARPSSRYVGSRFRDEVVAMSRRQRRRAFWGNVLLCGLCVAAMVLVGVLGGGMGGSV